MNLNRFIQKLKNIFWHLPKSLYYSYYYGFPSKKLTLIAVTGTDGKTTTVNLIHQILLQSGINAGVVSTLGAKIGEKNINVGLHTTSPDPKVVQKIFRDMVASGITHAVVEVTAHAIDQFRFFGCHFQVGVITNTSHEHLDDFVDINQYIKTKAKLFQNCATAILNQDDPSYKIITNSHPRKYLSYSSNHKADYRASEIKLTPNKMTFNINHQPLSTNSNYLYQVSNILAAYAVIDSLKLPTTTVKTIIKDFPIMKGRREEVKNTLGIHCIIDFAHTPAAIASTLETIRTIAKGKKIIIFGATGGRDPSKRPLMGRVVSQLADIAIITADDTRHEKVEEINQQIISGIDTARINNHHFTFYNIPNRQEAFNLAVKLASRGDIIIACGKGHEDTILHGNTEYPWSESEAFRTAFRYRLQKQ